MVIKNFALTTEQAEWLRTRSFETRQPQAVIVRSLINDAMEAEKEEKRAERKRKREERRMSLVQQYAA